MARIAAYAKKCRVLRQIQSNKAKRYRRINTAQNVATVTVSSFLTFIGLSGIQKIHTYANWLVAIKEPQVEFAFNLLVFILFVLVILHLVFQIGRKQSESERAIVLLTNLTNQIDDMIARAESSPGQIPAEDEELVRQRYQMLIGVIPANSDNEFLKARKDYHEKEAKQSPLQVGPADLFDDSRQREMVESLVRKSVDIVRILETVRSVDARLHLGGGLLRNLVWDFLHGFESPTPIDDVDVIYFDSLSSTKEHDRHLEELLRKRAPNLRWSVKNQGRMHMANNEEPYTSLEDAISKWPETATAFVAQFTGEGQLQICAPFGFTDLFRLIVVPTPHFEGRPERIKTRAEKKRWRAKWPRLRIMTA